MYPTPGTCWWRNRALNDFILTVDEVCYWGFLQTLHSHLFAPLWSSTKWWSSFSRNAFSPLGGPLADFMLFHVLSASCPLTSSCNTVDQGHTRPVLSSWGGAVTCSFLVHRGGWHMAQGVVGLVKGVSPPLSSAVSLLAFLPFSLLSNSQISYGEGKQECAGVPPGSGKSGGSFM